MKSSCAPSHQTPAPPLSAPPLAQPAASPRQYRPGTINLRSSMPKPCGFSTPRPRIAKQYVYTPSRGVTLGAFICGLVSEEAPYSKDSDRINRMDRINPSANPVNPVHPVRPVFSFSSAPDINCSEFIKEWVSQNSSPQSHHILSSCAGNEPVLCWFRYIESFFGHKMTEMTKMTGKRRQRER